MPSELNLYDFLINNLSEHSGVLCTLIHFPQTEKREAPLTLSLSWTQAQLPERMSWLCVERHNLRAALSQTPSSLVCSASLITWSPLHPLQHRGHRDKPESTCRPPEGPAGSVHSSTYQTWKGQRNCPQTTSEQVFLCAEGQGPSLPSNVVSPLLSVFTASLIGARVTALSWMSVVLPALCSVPMSLGHPGVYSPLPPSCRSGATLRLCSRGVRVRVLSWMTAGVWCRGKAGCTSLLPEHFGFVPLSRPARPSGKWHSLCMTKICLRRGDTLGIEHARNYYQNCEPTWTQTILTGDTLS